jgi:four helix bundle protein
MALEIEDRTIKFAVSVLKLIDVLPDCKSCNHLCGQLLRSSTATPLIYGEACAGESAQDFIHKMGVALKELKETRNCLKVIRAAEYCPDVKAVGSLLDENDQLIAIFGSSINTARKNLRSKN